MPNKTSKSNSGSEKSSTGFFGSSGKYHVPVAKLLKLASLFSLVSMLAAPSHCEESDASNEYIMLWHPSDGNGVFGESLVGVVSVLVISVSIGLVLGRAMVLDARKEALDCDEKPDTITPQNVGS